MHTVPVLRGRDAELAVIGERLDGLGHCWMAEDPGAAAAVLQRFWSSLEGGG
jgi:hypothetical protein